MSLMLSDLSVSGSRAYAATIKDAGDDPDVTHGAKVSAWVSLTPNPGVRFHAGPGVGTVTRAGLPVPVGEPAINPVPRRMMCEHLGSIAEEYAYSGGFEVTIGVENGAALALKTMNPRLGILGGLSILGTTGIVRPFSCSAYIASIHQGLDVARANDLQHIAAVTGSGSEAAMRAHYDLSDMAIIEMGDFAGGLLKYLKKAAIPKVSLCGGFGKLSKLAAGHLDLHSRASSIDFGFLAKLAEHRGANDELLGHMLNANTSLEALSLCRAAGIDLASSVCEAALEHARRYTPDGITLEVWAVDRQGRLLASASGEGAA